MGKISVNISEMQEIWKMAAKAESHLNRGNTRSAREILLAIQLRVELLFHGTDQSLWQR